MSSIRFTAFPLTEPPPSFVAKVVEVFRNHEKNIATHLGNHMNSDEVLQELRPDLLKLGFAAEGGKGKRKRLERPVFFGENGAATVRYEIDAYHDAWDCGLEVEAGRSWMGNAVYKDLVRALVMVELKYLIVAVPNTYRFNSGGKQVVSRDYENSRELATALYGHSRLHFPYGLIVLGY